jgi:hypothetical protein
MSRVTDWLSIAPVFVSFAASGTSSSQTNRVLAITSSINGPTALALDDTGHLYVIEGE